MKEGVRICEREQSECGQLDGGFTCRVKLIAGERGFVTFGLLVWGVVFTENAAGSGGSESPKNKRSEGRIIYKVELEKTKQWHE